MRLALCRFACRGMQHGRQIGLALTKVSHDPLGWCLARLVIEIGRAVEARHRFARCVQRCVGHIWVSTGRRDQVVQHAPRVADGLIGVRHPVFEIAVLELPVSVLSALAPSDVSGTLCSLWGLERNAVSGMWIDDRQRTA
jgi:hypothetical protein